MKMNRGGAGGIDPELTSLTAADVTPADLPLDALLGPGEAGDPGAAELDAQQIAAQRVARVAAALATPVLGYARHHLGY